MKVIYIHGHKSRIKDLLTSDFQVCEYTDVEHTLDFCRTADVVFIEARLAESDYRGLELGMHLRMDADPHLNTVPVVFVTDYDYRILSDLSEYADVLLLRGSYQVKTDATAICAFDCSSCLPADGKAVSRLSVRRPVYTTRHDITNQWCIYKWSLYIGIPRESIPTAREIKDGLYFKYLLKNHAGAGTSPYIPYLFAHTGKILLIDNEWKEGWLNFFVRLLPAGMQIDVLDVDYKQAIVAGLKQALAQKLQQEDPDLVIMDLRLLETDNSGNQFSSVELLEEIQHFNQGIATIVMTASNKAMHIQQLLSKGARGYIIKESPVENYGADYTGETIRHLCALMDEQLEKASFLKEVYRKMQALKTNWKKQLHTKAAPFVARATDALDIAFELLLRYKEVRVNLKFAYLTLFLVIEDYSRLPSVFIYDTTTRNYQVKDAAGKIIYSFKGRTGDLEFLSKPLPCMQPGQPTSDYRDTILPRYSYIQYHRFKKTARDLRAWAHLCDIRNRAIAHAGINPAGITVTEQNISELLDLMADFD